MKKYKLIPCKEIFEVTVNELIEIRNDIVIMSHDIGQYGYYKTTNSYDGIFDFIEHSLEEAKRKYASDYNYNSKCILALSPEEINFLYAICQSNDLFNCSKVKERLYNVMERENYTLRNSLTKRCLL